MEEASITVNDINLCLQVIDICSARGAFRGNELKDIGTLREKLSVFIEANKVDDSEGSEDSGESSE